MTLLYQFNLPELAKSLLNGIYGITLLGVILVIILDNRNPIKTVSWIIVLIFLPYVGLILYIFFGQRYRKAKMISKKSISAIENNPAYLYEELDVSSYPTECSKLIKLLRSNNKHPLFSGNDIAIYTSGKEKFRNLITDIENAKKFIHLDYYVIDESKIGYAIRQVLMEKAREGVEVRVIYDDLGCFKTKRKFFKEMRDCGVQVKPFLRVLLPYLSPKTNYRNHRKIAVIDGDIGYTGGMNIADRYIDGGSFNEWRDTHLRISGRGVYGLQTAFLLDWFFVSREMLTSKFYFPDISDKGEKLVQIATSGPDSDWEGIMQSIFCVINNAQKYVYLQTPYFLPNESLLTALQTAALSGVDIKILLPSKSDAMITTKAMHSYLSEIMRSGVKVYFYKSGFLHSKTIVADDMVSSVGSTNYDYRSFELNFEVNAFIYNEEFAIDMKNTFLKDLESSTEVVYSRWKTRPRIKKWTESICRVFGPML